MVLFQKRIGVSSGSNTGSSLHDGGYARAEHDAAASAQTARHQRHTHRPHHVQPPVQKPLE